MKLLFALLLWTSATGVGLIDEIQTIPAGDWAYRDVQLHREAARISASFEVLSGATQVRMALLLREDVEGLADDLTDAIVSSGTGARGAFTDAIQRRGDFAVVLDNRDKKQPATVRLRVWLDSKGPPVTSLPVERRATVTILSLAVFLGIVGFSARRLWRGTRRPER